MVLISNSLLILNPLLFRQAVMAVDPYLPGCDGFLGEVTCSLFGARSTSVWPWVLSLLLIAITSATFKYWMRMTFITVSRDAEMEIRSTIFDRLQRQSRGFFDRHGIGELLSRLTNDISAYRDVLGPGVMYPLFFLTLMIPGLIALFSISVPLTSISLVPLLVIPLVNFTLRGYIFRISLSVQKALGEMSSMVQEHFSAIRIIKSYVIEKIVGERFRKLCQKLLSMNIRLSFLQGSLFPFFTFLTKMITVILVMFSGIIIFRGWSDLNAADFVSFMWIQSYIFFPVLMLGWLIPVYGRGRAAYERILEIYEEPIEVQDVSKSGLKIPQRANIVFRDLSFSYPRAESPALSHIDLEIQGGSFVGITGPIGAGKTTLFHLLTREYEIPTGMIAIDGHDIHDYPLSAFHSEMVTVEQVPFLFSRSIAENVRFGRREASMEEVKVVTRYADFHDTVLEFPEKYETIIGERGVTLSGGQKQRLAMARAFLVNRSILLLDDIFSAVDVATEKRIFDGMKKNFRGKTVLLVTHRVSILEQMDRIIYLSGGAVLEDGTHKELCALKGHYAALTELQGMGIEGK
ncbi:MAG: putative multidrug resistance ABC transporter ATP-binding/permease protein YheI [Chlamydiae bacterium]|nr:putative multidrug resistance ABC transporter ATP-binding/permease protein YheI [Chlamydiota bacterium]